MTQTGYPVYIPAYSPFVYVPYTPGYYPATPGCMALSHGTVGSCAAGTCSGAVSAGACGAGHCGGGVTGGESDESNHMCQEHISNDAYRLQRWSDARRLWWWRLWRWRRVRLKSVSSLSLSLCFSYGVPRRAQYPLLSFINVPHGSNCRTLITPWLLP